MGLKEDSKLLDISHRIEKGEKNKITVCGKNFKIGDLKRAVLNKIYDIQFKVKYYEGKDDFTTIKKRVKYINSSDARVASLILLNELSYIPLLHAIHWRLINKRFTTEMFSAIIEAGLDNKEYNFFLKNSVIGQNLLATRMMMIKTS